MDLHPNSQPSALILRSLALAIIFYQIRLLAKDLVDTPLFIAALAAGFIAPWGLFQKKVGALPSVFIILLIPWTTRFFIALPRAFIPDTAVILDALLLNFDRNSFISLIPFYWIALTTCFAARSRIFLRADIIMADTLLVVIFSVPHTADIDAYRWPAVMILVFVGILFLQIAALILSSPPEFKVRRKEQFAAAAALLVLVLMGGFLFLGPFQEKAVDRGGGLVEPKFFKFDISQFLRLETEISMNDDLVFIMKKDPDDDHILLRRYVLSGYTTKQGFFRSETLDEKNHPQRLPDKKTLLSNQTLSHTSRITEQEYYLVNFDSSAFIGMNTPVLVTPFETWDASSFSSAYAVQSQVNEAMIYELFDSVLEEPSPQSLELSPEEYAFYTDYGGDQRIAGLARKIIDGIPNYQDRVETICAYLNNGDYRYSLKPGIAPDGDQLGYFLFQSKKGYCSYYAFSMALLLRSLGIPARVAVGFFIDPSTNTFNYYPVRSDMAHAWVEVYYPRYGWIEYDPTTSILAEDEEFRFSSGVPQELFERLMKEILDNHSRLTPKEGRDPEEPQGNLAAAGTAAIRFLRDYWTLAVILCLGILSVFLRTQDLLASRIYRNPRKKARRLWSHAKRRLLLGGYKRKIQECEAEWAKNLDPLIPHIYRLYQNAAAARYAPEYSLLEFRTMEQTYRNFAESYAKQVSLPRRILAWVLPPLAMLLERPDQPQRIRSLGKAAGVLLILLFGLKADAQNQVILDDPQSIYGKALESQRAEHWERAIELYSQGAELYPEDPRFSWSLGNLYYRRKLYRLAWEQYRKTETLLPEDTDVLYQLSRTAARLNQDARSADYLERILQVEPDNIEAIGNLGWMYFKLHRLGEGRQLLLSALEQFGPNADFAMTLGTIFTDLFQYEDAKKWYLEAIAQGEAMGDRTFTAVSHYNLSILETRFYQYHLAFDRTNASLRSQNRAPGRLARGELFIRRLDFKQAFGDYQAAYDIDPSPLSKVNLAQSYQTAGQLKNARLYAEDCLQGGDLSWMLNYGIDPVRYKRDLHEILYHTFAGLEQTEDRIPYPRNEGIRGRFLRLYYWFKKQEHLHLYRKYSLLSTNLFTTDRSAGGESNLDALMQYYNAFEAYPKRALTYLRHAREFEEPLIPASAAFYDYEEGRMLKRETLLKEALVQFDPLWERDMIAETYRELAQLQGNSQESAEALYRLNRGALRQAGINLPVQLLIDTGGNRRAEKAIRKAVKKTGLDLQDAGAFTLRIRLIPQGPGYAGISELFDGNQLLFNHTIPLNGLSQGEICGFAQTLGDFIFINE